MTTRKVLVGAMGGSARCRLCGCKPPASSAVTHLFTMVQLTVVFPVPELPERFTAICEPCALAVYEALARPAAP